MIIRQCDAAAAAAAVDVQPPTFGILKIKLYFQLKTKQTKKIISSQPCIRIYSEGN